MGNIKELWDLRAKLDGSVLNGNYEEIKVVKDAYNDLIKPKKYEYNPEYTCYYHCFSTEEGRSGHQFLNKNAIKENIEAYEKKYIGGEEVSLKLKMPHGTPFLAGEIWVLRAMYDKFLLDGKKCKTSSEKDTNMILGRAILEKLHGLCNMEPTDIFSRQLVPIIKEVRLGYESFYLHRQPRIDYHRLSDEFLEQ